MDDHYRELLALIGDSISCLSRKEIDNVKILENLKQMIRLSKNISSDVLGLMENIEKDIINFLQNSENHHLLKKIQKKFAYLIENLLEL